ncbi:MAG: hypothetical protein K2W96_27745, partial [Gemmataceae bacterium]|nr:hypothetical protein [Gemmataceae bacterium]
FAFSPDAKSVAGADRGGVVRVWDPATGRAAGECRPPAEARPLPGASPFAVHDLGGLRIGMSICYDGSFPESARVLALLGADLVVLPTNWPASARGVCEACAVRAMENHVYYAAIDRVGEERGWRFKGESRIHAPGGEMLAEAGSDPAVLHAEIDPAKARDKKVVRVPGAHEMDRMKDRRPDMYGPITG